MGRFLSMALFFGVGTLLVGSVHRWLWVRLVRDPELPGMWRHLGTALVVALAAFTIAAPAVARLSRSDGARTVATAAFTWMGLLFVLMLALSGTELLRGAMGLWRRFMGGADEALDPERRLFFARALGGGASLGAVAAGAAAFRSANRAPKLVSVEVPIADLPPALDGFRIVQISDLHVSATITRPYVEQVVAMANAQAPDMVALTGDLMDGSVPMLRDDMAPIADLRSRHGSFFVTGNHEYYSGADAWLAHFRSLGVRTLRNERVQVEHDGAALDVLGVDDWTAGRFGGDHGPDLARAAAGRDRSVPSLLLAHQPKQIDEAAAHGISLTLSGHTHGGQIWPFGYLVKLVQPYVAGLHWHTGASAIYVSRGTGYWGPPMRLAAPHELTLLTLRRKVA
ncbi:MAG: hypothetical protein RIT45_514 [Pseudomonadota bacterium]